MSYSIPVVVQKITDRSELIGINPPLPYFLVYVLSNPQLRAEGNSEEIALGRLKWMILGRIIDKPQQNLRNIKIVDLPFNEILITEVMES